MEQSLAVRKSAVTPWASRDDVRELGKRIKELLPGGQRLQSHEALALAQASVAHQLDPFNGELWFIPGRGLMAGIKGHRRAAHHQMEHEGGGNYWVEFIGPMTVDELAEIKAPAGALAYKCRLYDSKNISTYVEAVTKLVAGGVPWDIVHNVMGDRPFIEGIGYYVQGEQTKMTPVQCAQKRAEADALKRRFDLPFTMAVGVNGDSDTVDAEFSVGASEQDPAEVQARMQAASDALRGDQGDLEMETPYQPEGMPSVEQYTTPPVENSKPASLKFRAFVTWANEWVKGNGKDYANADGRVDMRHLLGRIGKLGFASVTEQNADDIKAALESFVKGKVDTQ